MSRLLRFFPLVTIVLFLGPVISGLVATVLPALGYLPALGGHTISLAPWLRFLATPGLGESVRLTLTSGFLATVLACIIVVGFCSVVHNTRLFQMAQSVLSPLLATPHVAVALGLSFLIAPSGWLVRLVSPWLTGWERPPDIAIVHDPWGLSFVLGLLLKEVPYLMLMTVAALGQVKSQEIMAVARSLGYTPVSAWLKTVLPQIYPQIRLPVYAVLAFSLSVVDVAVILAPTTPAPLSTVVFRMFMDRDLSMVFPASAGACLQLAIVILGICAWRAGERFVSKMAGPWLTGGRQGRLSHGAGHLWIGVFGLLVGLSILGTVAMTIWSVAETWFYPSALPASWSFDHWANHLHGLIRPGKVTLAIGLCTAMIALFLSVGCLQNERINGLGSASKILWLLYTPLLIPQIAFLFGVQVILVRLNLDGAWGALILCHLLFVFPYVFLSLADPWRAFDLRYRDSALALTGSPVRSFFQVELPLMLKPAAFAFAIGFAVSAGQYLSTVFAAGGRVTTLTVEAVTLSSGSDRRVIGIYALAQTALPLLVYAAAILIPAWKHPSRRS
jgi:putative thiamine transport system permease protein